MSGCYVMWDGILPFDVVCMVYISHKNGKTQNLKVGLGIKVKARD